MRLARREAGELLGAGAGFSWIALFDVICREGVHLVVARTLGAAALGHFTRALRLARAPGRLSAVVESVLLPAMARRQRETARLAAVYVNALEALSLVAVPASVMIAVCAPEIVAVVLGAQWDAAARVLEVLSLAAGLRACDAASASVVRASGAAGREARRHALYFLLLVGGAWLGARWGLTGVAVAAALAWVVLHLLLSDLAAGVLGLRRRRLARCHVPALWIGVWATAAVWGAAALARRADLPAPATLALAACGLVPRRGRGRLVGAAVRAPRRRGVGARAASVRGDGTARAAGPRAARRPGAAVAVSMTGPGRRRGPGVAP